MLRHELVITVPGDPAPKGSLKCIGRRGSVAHVLIEDNDRTKPWRDKVSAAVRRAHPEPASPGQPLCADVTFTLARPKSHYGTGRNVNRVRPAAPAWPTSHATGDVDKLLRLILDALQDAGLVPDDSAIVTVTTTKAYPTETDVGGVYAPDVLAWPGVRIRLYPIQTGAL